MSKIISSKYKLTIAQKHLKMIPRNESEAFSSLAKHTLKMNGERNRMGVSQPSSGKPPAAGGNTRAGPQLDIRQSVETLEHPDLNGRSPIPPLRAQ